MALLNSAVHTRQIREKLFSFINENIGTEYDGQLISAEAIAFSNLHPIKRSSYGSAYDHAVRVANCIIFEFGSREPRDTILSLLHDIIEDGSVELEDILNIFGDEIHDGIKVLTRKRAKDHEASRGFEKIVENISLFKAEEGIRLVKCADKLDNLRDMLMIPTHDKRYERIPRWIAEINISIIPLAKLTNPLVVVKMSEEIERIERIFTDKIHEFTDMYLNDMERLGVKIPTGHSPGSN